MSNNYKTYGVWVSLPISIETKGNIDGRMMTDFRYANKDVKGRNFNEAMRKAKRWYEDSALGMGSVTVKPMI